MSTGVNTQYGFEYFLMHLVWPDAAILTEQKNLSPTTYLRTEALRDLIS